MKSLTEPQVRLLKFLQERQESGVVPPTRREIRDHFGWKSDNAAQDHLAALQRKGVIRIERDVNRGIEVLEEAAAEPRLAGIVAKAAEREARLCTECYAEKPSADGQCPECGQNQETYGDADA